MELKPCPFCGGDAGILVPERESNHQIIGCLTPSMLCPNPTMVVYKDDSGVFDYKYWNIRKGK